MKSLFLPNFEPSIITTYDHRRALLCVQMLAFLFWEEAFRQCKVRCSVRKGLFLLSFLPSYFFLFSSEAKSQLEDKWSDESYTLPTFCVSASRFALGGSAGTFTLEIWEGAETSVEGCKILGRIRKLSENDKPACSYHVSTFSDSGYTMQLPWQACRNLRQTYAVEGRSYLWL